ncbi:MAG: PAS domain S-box protein [Proteobacteria bacterium]|nr:PAS domain S-box protein [Pseudomonadota bacterium]
MDLFENIGHKNGYKQVLNSALQTNKPSLTDIHIESPGEPPHISVVTPILVGDEKAQKPIGALVLVTDASEFLYPLIQFWPTPSQTAETYLVKLDGDHVLFLNNLRNQPGTALNLRLPLSRTDNPAVMAVQGKRGFVVGKDYRGVEVASVILHISGSPWFMVAKVAVAEAYYEWRFRSVLILLFLLGLTAFTGVAGLVLRQREQKVHYKALYHAESELLANMKRHSITLKAIGDAVIVTDEKGVVELLNPIAENLTGWSNDEACGKPLAEIFHIVNEETREKVEDPVVKVLREGVVVGLANHTLLIAMDGTERPIADSGAPICNDEGTITGVVLVFRDQTSEYAAQRALLKSEERFRMTFEQAAVGIAHIAPDGSFLRVNRKLCDIVGYSQEELLKKTFQKITCPEDLATDLVYIQQLLDGTIDHYSIQKRNFKKDGSKIWINLTVALVRGSSGLPDYFISVVEDITGSKKAEREHENLREQLAQAQKMESIGLLAGGVAHDYNNMLTVISGYAEMALNKYTAAGEPLYDDLMEILKASQRSIDITRQLLAFARKQTISPEVLDLNETVGGMLNMLRRLIGEDIDLSWRPGDNLWNVYMDPSQVDQILANLCVNARDAIGGVGKITIETGNVTFDETYCANHYGFVHGEFVLLAVSDDGSGMNKETLNHIFEPFFTTKAVGHGTGLGLATIYGIIKQNNGFLNVYSEPEKGSTFRIYFSRYTGEIDKVSPDNVLLVPHSHGETVLVVEDELAILKMGTIMLKKLGYKVLAASTPKEAMDLAGKHADDICLLITDVVLPDMNGRDLADQIRILCPEIKILFMSGYTANAIAHRGVLDEGVNFLSKPFSEEGLAVTVNKVLGRG